MKGVMAPVVLPPCPGLPAPTTVHRGFRQYLCTNPQLYPRHISTSLLTTTYEWTRTFTLVFTTLTGSDKDARLLHWKHPRAGVEDRTGLGVQYVI